MHGVVAQDTGQIVCEYSPEKGAGHGQDEADPEVEQIPCRQLHGLSRQDADHDLQDLQTQIDQHALVPVLQEKGFDLLDGVELLDQIVVEEKDIRRDPDQEHQKQRQFDTG